MIKRQQKATEKNLNLNLDLNLNPNLNHVNLDHTQGIQQWV